MFNSEIEERLLNTIVCPCDHRNPKACKKAAWKDFIALDDGVSWVMLKGEEEKMVDGVSFLYCVDEETDCMRKQNNVEVERSRRVLEECKGGKWRNMFFDDAADYVSFVFPCVESEEQLANFYFRWRC